MPLLLLHDLSSSQLNSYSLRPFQIDMFLSSSMLFVYPSKVSFEGVDPGVVIETERLVQMKPSGSNSPVSLDVHVAITRERPINYQRSPRSSYFLYSPLLLAVVSFSATFVPHLGTGSIYDVSPRTIDSRRINKFFNLPLFQSRSEDVVQDSINSMCRWLQSFKRWLYLTYEYLSSKCQ